MTDDQTKHLPTMNKHLLIGITPFEIPDARLVFSLAKAACFPVLSLGHDRKKAEQALKSLSEQSAKDYGVCFNTADWQDIILPPEVSLIIAPFGFQFKHEPSVKVIYQVLDLESAKAASAAGAAGIIVKGNEGAGKVAYESSFVLFQRVIKEVSDLPIWVQGGVGLHTAA